MTPFEPARRCLLALEDGSVFTGSHFGASGTQTGEVVFNTSMTGYQEVLTDPSYCGQIVTMTYPQIGNYGVNAGDVESSRPNVAGFVIKELARRYSNHRATASLEEYLAQHNVIGVQGIDTRMLTKRLRVNGTMRGAISTEIADSRELIRLALESPGMVGADLVQMVAPKRPESPVGLRPSTGASADPSSARRLVLAVDCGMKRQIHHDLSCLNATIHIVPPTIPADELLQFKPDGVVISNGPGDPAAVTYAVDLLKGLLGRVPLFGICLGHQLLGLALGAETFKLKFGHRGANQPVRNLATGRVEITAQNHGFAIDVRSLEAAGGRPTHVNLNDGTLEGFTHREWPILGIQYHPEASPGPHDAGYLFACFESMMGSGAPPTPEHMAHAQAAHERRLTHAKAERSHADAH